MTVQWIDNKRPAARTAETERASAVITVRLTPSQHKRLIDLAWRNRVSMNTLCVTAFQHFGEFLDSLEGAKEETPAEFQNWGPERANGGAPANA